MSFLSPAHGFFFPSNCCIVKLLLPPLELASFSFTISRPLCLPFSFTIVVQTQWNARSEHFYKVSFRLTFLFNLPRSEWARGGWEASRLIVIESIAQHKSSLRQAYPRMCVLSGHCSSDANLHFQASTRQIIASSVWLGLFERKRENCDLSFHLLLCLLLVSDWERSEVKIQSEVDCWGKNGKPPVP